MNNSMPPAQARAFVPWIVAAAVLALAGFVYWPGLGGGFAFDDYPNIVDNVALHVRTLDRDAWVAAMLSSPATDLQRPLAMFTFAVNQYFTGNDPVAMKATNLAIHLLNSLLVLALMRGVLAAARLESLSDARREWAARFTAAAWAVHPINLMAVLFVVQRMESLSHTFVFAGLCLYLQGRQRQFEGRNGWWQIGGGLLLGTALGLLAKESAVLLPLYACGIELCLLGFRNRQGQRDRGLAVLFACVLWLPALLGGAWLLSKALAPGAFAARDFSLGERLLTEGRVVLDYMRWTVVPDLGQLSLYHDDYPVSRSWWQPPATLLAALVLALLAVCAWCLRHRRPLTSLGLLWFFAAQVLTATILPLELAFEHRNYFASLGICLVFADLLLIAPRTSGLRGVAAVVAGLALTSFAGVTHLRAREWSDPYRFASSEVAKHPQSPRATYSLGQALVVMSAYQPDSPFVPHAFEALEHASRVPGSTILPEQGLLILAARTGAPMDPAWWASVQSKLRHRAPGPQDVSALSMLVRCARDRTCRFPPQEMLDCIDAALAHGRHPDVLTLYGDYALNVLHQPQLALDLWREAATDHPSVAQYQVNLTKLLIALGQDAEARERIAGLRRLGRLGRYDGAADELAARMRPTP